MEFFVYFSDVTCVGEWPTKELYQSVVTSGSADQRTAFSSKPTPSDGAERTLIVKSRNGAFCINYVSNQTVRDETQNRTQQKQQEFLKMKIFNGECGTSVAAATSPQLLLQSDRLSFRGPCQEALTDAATVSRASITPFHCQHRIRLLLCVTSVMKFFVDIKL